MPNPNPNPNPNSNKYFIMRLLMVNMLFHFHIYVVKVDIVGRKKRIIQQVFQLWRPKLFYLLLWRRPDPYKGPLQGPLQGPYYLLINGYYKDLNIKRYQIIFQGRPPYIGWC